MSSGKKTNQFTIINFPTAPFFTIFLGAHFVKTDGLIWMPVSLLVLFLYTCGFRSVVDVLKSSRTFLVGYALIPSMGLLSPYVVSGLGVRIASVPFSSLEAIVFAFISYFFVLFFHNRRTLTQLGWVVN